MIVFDSACAGKDVGDAHLTFDLPPGAYSILTKQFQPDERTSVLVHKFEYAGVRLRSQWHYLKPRLKGAEVA
jgi:hypothetical protein